ncbi:MAG: UDP-glucose 4-epimerase GalE [Hyphomicrobium sp.]|nr:MAG: UDP-glucose 4-epimerase GalE [Hyphomicrobium sp.]PPD01599.1 MAG: UDP-glucose 4-epimerase GalE [Hyphomicrobium sp.]
MNLLITGGAGYVGSHCTKRAVAAGHKCVVFDNLKSGHKEFVRWGPLIHADIRDTSAIRRALSEYNIDAVMHFAALAYVGESVDQPASYYDVNVNGTRVLLDAMVATNVKQLVFSSSCAIYGQPEIIPISEESTPLPINPYGFTKFACERMISDYSLAYGLHSVCLRYFNAAGADPDCEIGEDHDPETHLIPLVLDTALRRRNSVAVFGDDYATADGTAVRDYVHVADLADAHTAALSYLENGGDSVVMNLGTGCGISVNELILKSQNITGRAIHSVRSPRRTGDPAELIAKPGLAKDLIGWEPRRSNLEVMLADAWAWHIKRFA